MIDERQEELAAMHSLDLLEGAEREQFLKELSSDPGLRKKVAEFRGTGSALALLAPEAEPPAELRERILHSIATRGADASKDPAPRSERARVIPFPAWIPWLAAACIAGAAAWYGRLYLVAEDENSSLREQQRVSQLALGQARAELEDAKQRITESGREITDLGAKLKSEGDLAHFKISMLASMLGNSPAAVAVAVWDPARGQGVLSVSKLPAIAAEKDYQLWVIDAKYPAPVSAGTFAVDPLTGEAHVVFRADKPVNAIAKFAVSLERKGGVLEPEGPIVLLSQ
jgi:anti-sigma-K factor RskA